MRLLLIFLLLAFNQNLIAGALFCTESENLDRDCIENPESSPEVDSKSLPNKLTSPQSRQPVFATNTQNEVLQLRVLLRIEKLPPQIFPPHERGLTEFEEFLRRISVQNLSLITDIKLLSSLVAFQERELTVLKRSAEYFEPVLRMRSEYQFPEDLALAVIVRSCNEIKSVINKIESNLQNGGQNNILETLESLKARYSAEVPKLIYEKTGLHIVVPS